MPAETKRKFQTGQPVSTRRRAKKQKLAVAQAERDAVTPSKKAQRKANRPPKPVKARKPTESAQESDEDDIREDSDEDEDQEDEEEEAIVAHSKADQASDDDEDEHDDESDEEQVPIGRGKKGYKSKVKKPSGKKGKVFADTNAMLSIIDQVAGKEEQRAQVKQANMGKIKSKQSAKEQKQTDKEKAKKALIEQKIEEIKRKKTDKRKEAKHRAVEQEAKASASSGKRSVSFQL
ncbi:hypothetical protein BGZ67_001079 [Mortierella alpina]|nr:hypothetical protein BGZ67_001079 [Mortierella alpina]